MLAGLLPHHYMHPCAHTHAVWCWFRRSVLVIDSLNTLLLALPAPNAVEYWDEQERAWKSVEHAKSKYAVTASSQPSTPVVDSRSKCHL